MNYSVFVSCAKGMEYLLEAELKQLGFLGHRVSPQGVFGEATDEGMYRICLWSRLASRVHLILFRGPALNQQTLYATCREFAWDEIFSVDKTLAVVFHGESEALKHSLFGAQVVKDAVVDFFREKYGERPQVERKNPAILLHAHLKHESVTVSLDMTGMSLHQRGYRLQAGLAPLKETVAAAMLVRMQWPQLLKEGYALLDPCCGSGTLLIEAMMMSANIAPGLLQDQKAFVHWKGYSDKTWKALCIEAQQRQCVPEVLAVGSDEDARVLDFARANALRAGVSDWIEWREESIAVIRPSQSKGLVISNPPYGVRLEDEAQLVPLYRQLGEVLHTYFQGWQAGILTSNLALAKAIGLRAHKQYTLYNGPLECKLVCIALTPTNQLKTLIAPITVTAETLDAPDVQMFANRLEKNQIKLKKWAKLNHMDCYRVYDADLPDYAFAIDCYQDYAVVQEYAAPALIDVVKVERRRVSALAVIPRILNIPPDHLIFKQRRAQKGKQQYEKLSQAQLTLTVREGRARLRVNLTDYLDTGLFLDHRPLRLLFESLAPGTRFLNCFCYTASASVHAALAGATTVNVDLSNTYLEWAEANFKLNQLDLSKHQFVQYDCLTWLQVTQDKFDVIFLDPPTFSNSKRMQAEFDVQRDHERLIQQARQLLNPNGILYFSTNLRQFKLASHLQQDPNVVDITPKTLDIDFKRNPRIHMCFKITAV